MSKVFTVDTIYNKMVEYIGDFSVFEKANAVAYDECLKYCEDEEPYKEVLDTGEIVYSNDCDYAIYVKEV